MIAIFAPNVRSGGGLVLLKEILKSFPRDEEVFWIINCILEDSIHVQEIPKGRIKFFSKGIISRIRSEIFLSENSDHFSHVIMFNGSVPFFRIQSAFSVYVQNKILLTDASISGYSLPTTIRLIAERIFFRRGLKRAAQVFVQTGSMFNLCKINMPSFDTEGPRIKLLPFGPSFDVNDPSPNGFNNVYLYPADFQYHKNHFNLIRAWGLFPEDINQPKLFLTLDEDDFDSVMKTSGIDIRRYGNVIINLGALDHDKVIDLYAGGCALIFPSLLESFGIPLIEADRLNAPIVASELDFVRDVCIPAETFDPLSPLSIMRAVLRHIGESEQPLKVPGAESFWEVVLNK